MPLLVLTDDELALLRFTCDLYFVEESPLHSLDLARREPADLAATYHALVERGIIDPRVFRIADGHLNRIAPVTECDARVVHAVRGADGKPAQIDYWLLDEIAVSYSRVDDRHVFGADLDQDELVETLARHLLPRRAGGDRLHLTLAVAEFLALSLLLEHARQARTRTIALADLPHIFRQRLPEGQRGPALFVPGRRAARSRRGALVEDPAWDEALRALMEKGGARLTDGSLWLHAGIMDLATGDVGERHTIIRTDFGENDWLVRETTFVPVDGSLYCLGPRRGGMGVEELDGGALRRALTDAVGAGGRERAAGQARGSAELLARADPLKA